LNFSSNTNRSQNHMQLQATKFTILKADFRQLTTTMLLQKRRIPMSFALEILLILTITFKSLNFKISQAD